MESQKEISCVSQDIPVSSIQCYNCSDETLLVNKAKFAFVTFLVSFFSKFVLTKLNIDKREEYYNFVVQEFEGGECWIDAYFFFNGKGKRPFVVKTECDIRWFLKKTTQTISKNVFNTLQQFVLVGYKSNGKRVFLRPEFLIEYVPIFFKLFNDNIYHDLSSCKITRREFRYDYNINDSLENGDIKEDYVIMKVREILDSISIYNYLSDTKPIDVIKKEMSIGIQFIYINSEDLNNKYRQYAQKILSLLERLVFDKWYVDKKSKVKAKNKCILPQEIRNMILSYICVIYIKAK